MININKWLKQESGHIEMSENNKILQRFWFISTVSNLGYGSSILVCDILDGLWVFNRP